MNLTFITRMLLHASDDLHKYLHSQHEEWNQCELQNRHIVVGDQNQVCLHYSLLYRLTLQTLKQVE